MVFKSEKQRKGFFANVSKEITKLKEKREQKRLEAIERETKKLQELRAKQAKTLDRVRKEEQARLEILKQKKELEAIKAEEKEIKKQLFETTKTGRAVSLAKKEARAIATSPTTKKLLRKAGKELGFIEPKHKKRK